MRTAKQIREAVHALDWIIRDLKRDYIDPANDDKDRTLEEIEQARAVRAALYWVLGVVHNADDLSAARVAFGEDSGE